MGFLQDLYMITESKDIDALPEDIMNEIQKNIRAGAKDLEQKWANALELVHKAYEVSGTQRPTPDMKNAWKQYEENLMYAVGQLSKFRGVRGDWRMSSAIFHEALQRMIRFKVTLTSPGYSTTYLTEARSLKELIDYITAEEQKNNEYRITINYSRDATGAYLQFYRFGIKIKYRVDIQQIGIVGVAA